METTPSGRPAVRLRLGPALRTLGTALVLHLVASSPALAQQIRVSGTVTTAGAPLPGVSVRVLGADSSTAVATTNAAGRYTITAPSNGALAFSLLGYRRQQAPINGRTTVDVSLEKVAMLEQVVVTAYSGEQRRSEITGAVASVNVEATQRQTTASVLQRLDANVTGVTVDNSGSPGSRSTVRIRGISSFQNNDPLYIVDGTPVQDSYVNFLNPNDVASIQVLKDASAASIYGSRASNGVVIIETTKRGQGAPQTRLRVRTGIATPVRGYDDFLITDALQYYQVVTKAYQNAGYKTSDIPTNIYGSVTNPTVPAYIYPNNCNPNPCQSVDLSKYSYPNNLIMPGSTGTDWWKAVFGTGQTGDYNLDVTGGGTANSYAVSFNFFDQKGTAIYNRYQRTSVRANTGFTRGRFQVGENLSVSGDRGNGGLAGDPGGYAEDGIIGKNILLQPVIPVYDVQGNFAGAKAQNLGNQSNPVGIAYDTRNNVTQNGRIFGNVYGAYDLLANLNLRSTLGINAGQTSYNGYNRISPENSEPNFTNSINEWTDRLLDYTWSNTANYRVTTGAHTFALLLGQEANRTTSRRIDASIANLVNNGLSTRYVQDVLGDASTKNVSSSGGRSGLLSFFGRADYNLADRYTLSFTLRRDGSSRLGPEHRWGTFPAIGAGWRLSQESFLRDNKVISDAMLRVGYGVTGNQQIPAGRIVSQFGGERGATYYDITGSDNKSQVGFRLARLGNADLKWEENRSINAGLDLGLFDNNVNVIVDVYNRNTDNLLVDPPNPATAGSADAPFINIGRMRNRGIDASVSHRGRLWDATLNLSHYKNKIIRIDGERTFFYGPISTRNGNQVINQVGSPIGAFYGYISEGIYQSDADVKAHAAQDGAKPGRLKFKDVNGDGKVTLADRTVIGSPHPDLTAGLDLGFHRGAWDLNGTIYGTFGNDIFDVQKEFYVFRLFNSNVRKDRLTDSWTPDNPGAKYPALDQDDNVSSQLSSFYVEDGSYVRLRNLQLGYTLPSRFRYLANSRIYLQAENLFTITGYDGLDPSLPAANITNASGADIRDQYRGIDRGTYPSNRTFSIGLVTSF